MNDRADREKIAKMVHIVRKYREPGLVKVFPKKVVPDTTNRAMTGLSVEHMHFIANKIATERFKPHKGTEGHDIPVCVRETRHTKLGQESLAKWNRSTELESGFPRTGVPYIKNEKGGECSSFFTSLGNGHFFQSLNCFRTNHRNMYQEEEGDERYEIGNDKLLQQAIFEGVPCVVLNSSITRAERKFVSEVLNSTSTFKWDVDDDGGLNVSNFKSGSQFDTNQFEAISKTLDSFELGEFVREKLEKMKKGKPKSKL